MTESSPSNSFLTAWTQTLRRRGAAPAILGTDGRRLRSFTEIEEEARVIEVRLGGLPPRAVVAVQIGNGACWPALLLALFRRALIPLPLGRHVEAAELEQVLVTCGAAALITAEGERLVISPRAEPVPPEWDAPVPDFLKITSGTTSAPRAVRFRAQHLVADGENICRTMGLTERDLNFGVIPFSHSYGFSNLLTPLLCRGVALVASEDRLPRAIVAGLARTGATVFPGMPVFFQKCADLTDAPALPQLRLCISAGAPLPAAVGRQFSAKFGVKVHTFYGSSECGGIAYDRTDVLEYEEGFVGTPMEGVEVGQTSGEPGSIMVRGVAVGDGYFPQPDAAVLGSGRFVPGDLVRRTERGLFLTGRTSDVINIAGRKLNPAEVEARIAACPGVRQAVVFGVPSALRGEEAVACVSGEGIDAAGVMQFCRGALSQWQLPRDVWLVPEIPANERGKISRRALAETYCSEQRRRTA